ncbi:MAG TPA: hypothetical protein ENL16_03750 [Candidatus Woesearchaeota archaeon]|nr:hypothetical protein [Candidatus Woesearchaeota archaeon]
MFLEVLRGILVMANSFIALFIVIYAVLFLKKTKSHKERRPWDYLVIASMIYLAYTLLLMLFTIYKVTRIFNLSVAELNMFFQFLYTGLILLAFISQTDLIFKNEIIIITRKLSPEEKKRLEIRILKRKKEEKKKPEETKQAKKSKVYIS